MNINLKKDTFLIFFNECVQNEIYWKEKTTTRLKIFK